MSVPTSTLFDGLKPAPDVFLTKNFYNISVTYYKVQFLPLHADANPPAGEEWWSYRSNIPLEIGQIVVCEFAKIIAPAIVIDKELTSEEKILNFKSVLGYYSAPVLTSIGKWCISAYKRTGITAADWFFLRLLRYPELWLALDRKASVNDDNTAPILKTILAYYLSSNKTTIETEAGFLPLELDPYVKIYQISIENVLNSPYESLSTIPILSTFEDSDIEHFQCAVSHLRQDDLTAKKEVNYTPGNQFEIITNTVNTWPEVLPITEMHITKYGITSINQVLKHITEEAAGFGRIAVIVPEKWWINLLASGIPQDVNIYLTYEHNCIKNILSNLAAAKNLSNAIFVGQRELLFINCLFTFDKIIVVDVDNDGHLRQQKPRFHSLELILQLDTKIDLFFSSPTIYYPECKYRIMKEGNIINTNNYTDSDTENITFTGLNPDQLKETFSRFSPKRPVLIHHNRIGFGHYFKCRSCGKTIRDYRSGKVVRSFFVDDVAQFTTDNQLTVTDISANSLFGCPHSEVELIRYGIDGLAFDLTKLGFEVQIIDAHRKFQTNPLSHIYICTNAINYHLPLLRFGLIAAYYYSDAEAALLRPSINRLAWKFADDKTELELIRISRSKAADINSLPIASQYIADILEDKKQRSILDGCDQNEDYYEEEEVASEDEFDVELYKLLGLPPFGCQIEIAVRVKLHAPSKVTKIIDDIVKAFKPISFRIFKGFTQTNYRVHLYRALIKPSVDLMQLAPLLAEIRSAGGQPVIRWDRLGL